MRLTKVGLLLISVALLLTLSVANMRMAMASPQPTRVFVDPPETGEGLSIGETFVVKVNISDAFDIKTFSLKLSWYGPILHCVSVAEGDFLTKEGGSTFGTKNIWNGLDPVGDADYVGAGYSLLGIGGGVGGGGSLIEITFQVEANGQSGLHIYQLKVIDSLGDPPPEVVIEDGNFDNEGWAARGYPGDVDGDYDVDIVDLMIIARAMGTTPAWPHGTDWHQWNPDADLNGDSRVDVLDLMIAAINFGEHL